jgi:hypothetical protein
MCNKIKTVSCLAGRHRAIKQLMCGHYRPNHIHSIGWVDYKTSPIRSVCRLSAVCLPARYCVGNSQPISTKLGIDDQTTK